MAVGAAPVAAQEVPTVTLDEALRLFAENNLELRIARSRAQQAAALVRQAGAFANPTLSATHEPLTGEARSYSETYLTASQRFEVSGSRGARSDAAEGRYGAALQQYRADSLRVAFEVKRAYAAAVLAQEKRAVTERVTLVFREAATSATERYAAGDISLYALRRIEVERARYETRLADADLQAAAAQRALALLVAPSGEVLRLEAAPLPGNRPPAPPGGAVAAVDSARRPELAAARAEAEAAAAEARLTRAERVPDLTATGGFKRQSDGVRGAFLGLSAPLPLFDRNRGAVEAAEAATRVAEEREELTRGQVRADILQAQEAYEALRARAALVTTGTDEPQDDLLGIALVAYAEGAMELVELLDAADALHEARSDEARLSSALWIAYFDLERALGGFGPASGQEEAP